MNHKKFNELLDQIVKRTTSVLASKSKEYSTGIDKLHNFKRAGSMLQCSPEKALVGMWTKHIVSILDMVDELEQKCGINQCCFPSLDPEEFVSTIEEKIGDAINYLILLEALIKERKQRVMLYD